MPFALLLATALAAGDAAHVIALRSGVVDVRSAEPAPVARPEAGDDAPAPFLVKFAAPVTAAQARALRERSARVVTSLPRFAFLVTMRPSRATEETRRELGASWIGPWRPAHKVSPEAAAARRDEAGPAAGVLVWLLPGADADAFAASRRREGARVAGLSRDAAFPRVRLLLSPSELAARREALARSPEVFWIEREARRVLLNDTTIWVGQSGLAGGGATPLFTRGLFGEGEVIAVLDTGIDADMCHFRDAARGLPPVNPCDGGTTVDSLQRKVLAVDFLASGDCAGGIGPWDWDDHDHGTHVAGTAAGDDAAQPLAHDAGDGMAPGAKLVIQDGGAAVDDCADLPGIGCPVVDLKPIFQQAYDQGARLHTNSWGDQENAWPQNDYTAACRDADEFLFTHPDFLLFFAAGNSGPGAGSVSSPSTAKSVVSVGATDRGASAGTVASFSSCGLTADGRRKPEVTIPGSSILSADADGNVGTANCSLRSMSGTSMASPAAAGLAALVRQYFVEGWYPSGAANAADAFGPSGALVRAALVNAAQPMEGETAFPSSCQGWGRLQLDRTLAFPGGARRLWVRDERAGFATGAAGEERTFALTVNGSAEPLKVTLAWTDYPSTPAAAVNLNNDLDLFVAGPGGSWRGNVFSGGLSAAGGAADRRNTLEQVLLASPAPGVYTVTVRAFDVPDGPQPFALVVTGDVSEPASPAPLFFHTLLPCRAVDTRLADGALGGPALAAGVTRVFPVAGACGIPATARALALNLTAVSATGEGALSAFAAGGGDGGTSVLRFAAGRTRASAAIVALGPTGLAVRSSASAGVWTHVLVDVVGWFE